MKIVCFSFLLMCVLTSTNLVANEGDFIVVRNDQGYLSPQDKSILEAINHLDKACLLSKSIENLEIQESVCGQLRACINCLKKELFAGAYENAKATSLTLYENLGEILADLQNIQLRDDISHCVTDMMDVFEE